MIWLLLTATLLAQDLDIGHIGTPKNRGSLVSRAGSDAERNDYLELLKTPDASKRRALADRFLERYPQSWLLAGVYQISAGASLDLKDNARVLEDGRASLRLLPENAPLLLALAQIELAQGKLPAAYRDARDALLWLSLFEGPAGVKESDWKKTREDLEQFARAVIARTGGRLPAEPSPGQEKERARFAGSEACKTCHKAIYESWQSTGMAAMLHPVREAEILADFSQLTQWDQVRMGGGDKPYFEFLVEGGAWKRYRVDYVIGSKWQQAYATRLADNRIFVFPIQFNALQKKWVNYWAMIDPAGSERTLISQFPRLSNATSYQRNCAVCHTSQLRLVRQDDDTMQHAVFREPGVNCEMCHGPSARHAADPASPGETPFKFAKLDRVQATMICGQCHRQSAIRNLGSGGEMNYTSNPPYYNRLISQPFAEFGNRAFYKDGRFRETTFIGEAFMRSACFRGGTAQCASCHNPHPSDPRHNRVSFKFAAVPDRMCTQCHSAIGARAAAHTHHPAASAGSRCAACHMPPIMNSLMFPAASHQIDDIPRAGPVARFGREESPNACLICHKDKDIQWLTAQLRAW
ncbi:MAG: hypothetical protein IT165_25615 [Bryobacterales bacterium]|nr:hypothetical protein [Bryobacterales bacterium]